jgi:hypothetical protein
VASDDSGSAFAGLGRRGLVHRMHEQLDELLAGRDQMEQLLRVIVEIGSDLDLDATLRRIVMSARDLTSAPYGALAIRDPDGALISFIHNGIDAETVQQIGPLPVGKGVLSVSLLDTPALRLDDLTAHPVAVGFPKSPPGLWRLRPRSRSTMRKYSSANGRRSNGWMLAARSPPPCFPASTREPRHCI